MLLLTHHFLVHHVIFNLYSIWYFLFVFYFFRFGLSLSLCVCMCVVCHFKIEQFLLLTCFYDSHKIWICIFKRTVFAISWTYNNALISLVRDRFLQSFSSSFLVRNSINRIVGWEKMILMSWRDFVFVRSFECSEILAAFVISVFSFLLKVTATKRIESNRMDKLNVDAATTWNTGWNKNEKIEWRPFTLNGCD